MFGTPIMLTFKGDNKFKTVIGSILTVACIVTIGGLGVNGLIRVFQNKMISFSSETYYANTDSVGATGLNPIEYDFHAAIGFMNRKLDPTFGKLAVSIVNITSQYDNQTQQLIENRSEQPVQLQECSISLFEWSKYFQIEGVAQVNQQAAARKYVDMFQNISCPDFPNFNLQGKLSSLNFQYVRFELLPCVGTGCKNRTQIDSYFQNQALSFIFNDYYFHFQEDEPIQSYINERNSVTLQASQEQVMNLYLQKSHVEQYYLYNNTSKDLYQMGQVEKSSKLRTNAGQAYATFYLRLYDMQVYNRRNTFGLLDWISSIGGIARTLTFAFEVAAFFFSYQLFISTVLKNLFFIKKSLFKTDVNSRQSIPRLSGFSPDEDQQKSAQLWSEGNIVGDFFTRQKTQNLQRRATKNLTIDDVEYAQYKELKQDISESRISKTSVHSIVLNIWTKRARFGGILGNWAFLKFYLLGFCKCCLRRDRLNRRLYTTYLNGIRKFNKQLDVISLLRSVRLSKVLYYTTLNTRQSLMMQFQRTNLVESTDNTQESDYLDTVRDLNHSKKMVRLFALGKINRVLKQFSNQKQLSVIDTHLLKGFYTNARSELDQNSGQAIASILHQETTKHPILKQKGPPIEPVVTEPYHTPEKSKEVSFDANAKKANSSIRKIRKVTISKETSMLEESPEPEVKPPEAEKNDSNIVETERRLFIPESAKKPVKPTLQQMQNKP